MTDHPLARFQITRSEISRVVERFYARVRADAVLGPVFGAHVQNWPEHEEKIAAFWRNAILREPGYDGFPMREHLTRPDVKPEHFPIWLGLFHETLHAELTERQALQWGDLADKIGEGFRAGVENVRRPADQPPRLI
ncbi:Group 3 truncated hemoglobin ctb [Tritonibacter multivorans]|uniref:Group 3 truncated hemoglobin ctb n=1 Tax=Tritonibacter multivorans TaxID=928856 RepID=A0A0P1G1M1_9RHOB|nr:group III truncated hemoglobin [Tritonibacter multivorans]MDA7419524.1 group III truncated hemoglobin [Tritonibacter multivorans]CUH75634.1 Group 3 truncated hemoglobin ctb [Tritonibacter multivorans]SFC63833.1 hemoglobin [Tritonibacter multivorans]